MPVHEATPLPPEPKSNNSKEPTAPLDKPVHEEPIPKPLDDSPEKKGEEV